MLSFELKTLDDCDASGLKHLIAQLRFLADGKTDHVHFMAQSWVMGSYRTSRLSKGTFLFRM
jgi:hypothetical protein